MPGRERIKIKFFLFALLIALIDFLSKRLILSTMHFGESLPVIYNIFHISLIGNKGSAFGLFKNFAQFFLIFSILTSLTIIWIIFASRSTEKSYYLSFSLILAGAVGNLVDRITVGFVIDFLDFRVWPAFNIADSAITIGVCLLMWGLLFRKRCIQ